MGTRRGLKKTWFQLCGVTAALVVSGLTSLLGADFSADDSEGASSATVTRPYVWEFDRGLLFHDVFRLGVIDGRRRESFLMHLSPGSEADVTLEALNSRLARRLVLNDINVDQVAFEENRIHGLISMNLGRKSSDREMGHGRNAHSMMKSGLQSVLNWHIGGRERVHGALQTFEVDLQRDPGTARWVMDFSGLIGEHIPAKPPSPDDHQAVTWEELSAYLPKNALDFQAILDRYADNHWELRRTTCGWNKGQHQIDASQLTFAENRLQGVLVIHLMPDAWVPAKNQSLAVQVTCDVPVQDGIGQGVVQVEGPWGSRTVPVSLAVFDLYQGSYTTKGIDGSWSGQVEVTSPRGSQGLLPLQLDHVPSATESDFLAAAEGYLAAAWETHLQRATPALPQVLMRPTEVGEQWQAARDAAVAAQQQPVSALQRLEQPSFLPPSSAASYPIGEALTGAPGDTVTWQRYAGWQTLGPFIQYPDEPALAAASLLPPVFASYDTYFDARRQFAVTVARPLRWQAASEKAGRQQCSDTDWQPIWVHSGKMSSYKKHPLAKAYRALEQKQRSLLWYAKHEIEIQADGMYYFALQVQDRGALWIDQQLVWQSESNHQPHTPMVFALQLSAGRHELLLQIHKDRTTYFPPAPKDRSGFQWWWCVAGGPGTSGESKVQSERASEQISEKTRENTGVDPNALFTKHQQVWGQGLSRYRATSSMPLAWDDATGMNVAWSHTAPQAGQPVVWGEVLLVPIAGKTSSSQLRCLDLSSGDERWSANIGVAVHATEAPLVDERGIWQRWAGGLVTHHDLHGQEVWRLQSGLGPAPLGSTALLGDVLVCAVPVTDARGRIERDNPQHFFVGYAAQDGSEVWRTAALSGTTPRLAVVAPSAEYAVVVTAHGDVIDGTDGAVLTQGLWAFPAHVFRDRISPVVTGNTVYWATAYGQMAIDVLVTADPTGPKPYRLTFQKRWEQRRGARGGSTGLMVGETLFVPRVADEYHDHHPVTWVQLDVYDALTGQHLSKPKPVLRDAINPGHLIGTDEFIVYTEDGTGSGGLGVRYPQARMIVLSTEDQPRVLASHAWQRGDILHRTPVITDNALVVRVNDTLFCYRSQGADGSAYEQQQKAKAVFERIGLKPRPLPVQDLPPLKQADADVAGPMNAWISGVAPEHWLLAGPWSQEQVTVSKSLPASLQHWRDKGFALPEIPPEMAHVFSQVPATMMSRRASVRVQTPRGERFFPSYGIDLRAVFGKKRHQFAYFVSHCFVDQEAVYQLDFRARGTKVYLNGQPVEHETHVRLKPGYYQQILQVHVSRLAPVGRPTLAPKWYHRDDPRYTKQLWYDRIARNAVDLQATVAQFPDQPQQLQAQQYLDELEKRSQQE